MSETGKDALENLIIEKDKEERNSKMLNEIELPVIVCLDCHTEYTAITPINQLKQPTIFCPYCRSDRKGLKLVNR